MRRASGEKALSFSLWGLGEGNISFLLGQKRFTMAQRPGPVATSLWQSGVDLMMFHVVLNDLNKVSNAVCAFLPPPSPCFPLGLGREYCSPTAITTVLSFPMSSPMLWHFLICVLSSTSKFFRAVYLAVLHQW